VSTETPKGSAPPGGSSTSGVKKGGGSPKPRGDPGTPPFDLRASCAGGVGKSKVMTREGIEPPTFRSGVERATIAPPRQSSLKKIVTAPVSTERLPLSVMDRRVAIAGSFPACLLPLALLPDSVAWPRDATFKRAPREAWLTRACRSACAPAARPARRL
jgi:hypothetical protein